MKIFRFETETRISECDQGKYWIDSGYVRPFVAGKDTLKEAVDAYIAFCEKVGVEMYASTPIHPMFQDRKDGESEQIGLIIEALAYIYDEETGLRDLVSVDLWVEITEVVHPDFNEIEQEDW